MPGNKKAATKGGHEKEVNPVSDCKPSGKGRPTILRLALSGRPIPANLATFAARFGGTFGFSYDSPPEAFLRFERESDAFACAAAAKKTKTATVRMIFGDETP